MTDPMAEYVELGWSGQLPMLIGIAAVLGLGKGGVPGLATVATAATVVTAPTDIVGGLQFAVALQVPILTMIDVSAAWLHFKDLDVQTIILLLPTSFCGMFIGIWLSEKLSDAHARLLTGVFLLLILAVQLGKDAIMDTLSNSTTTVKGQKYAKVLENDQGNETLDDLALVETGGVTSLESQVDDKPLRKRSPSSINSTKSTNPVSSSESIAVATATTTSSSLSPSKMSSTANHQQQNVDQKTKLIWACVVGIIGGASTILSNAMGPILNVYLLSVVQLSPVAYIGTRAAFFCFLNCGKLPMRFLNGTLGWEMIPLAAFLGLVSVVGVMCAKPIMLSMKEEHFVKLELAVVAFSGIRLCWMGLYG